MGGGGGEGGEECEEDQNSSNSLHVSEMFKLLGAFTPEMPITLSFLARLDEVQKSLCTTPGVGVGVSVHIYVKVFSMAYIFQIT